MKKFHTTTAIDYLNGTLQIEHNYEKILTTVIYRHFIQKCNDVFFLTGSDEHAIKIQKILATNNISLNEIYNTNANQYIASWKSLDVDYSRFIRTTGKNNKKLYKR